MTNIAIVASGTRGDVQPYIALGKGLKEAGYHVSVLTSDDFESLVTEASLDFKSIGVSVETMLQSEEWSRVVEGGNFLKILSRMQAELKSRAYELAAQLPPVFETTDLVVTGMSGMGGAFSLAEKMGLPVIEAYVLPLTPTQEFPSPLTATLPFGTLGNQFSFHVMRQMLWQSTRIGDVAVRRTLKLPSGSFWGPFRGLSQKQLPVLYGYSQHVLPRPRDWEAKHHLTGYWFLDASADWTPPDRLVDFLQSGPPPVYIGFGSMGHRKPQEATELALKALALSGQRGVLASGWGGLSQTKVPDTVYMLSSAPHSWLFPRMAAVVHHGGAGTTAAGLRAGVPSIITPFMGDQPFWGQRIATLGVGPKPISRKRVTAEQLANAIKQAVSDQDMRLRASRLGEKIRAEDGVKEAVSIITGWQSLEQSASLKAKMRAF